MQASRTQLHAHKYDAMTNVEPLSNDGSKTDKNTADLEKQGRISLAPHVQNGGNLENSNTIPLSARTPKSSKYEKNFGNEVAEMIFSRKRAPPRKGSFASSLLRSSPPQQQETEASPRRISCVTTPIVQEILFFPMLRIQRVQSLVQSNTESPRRLFSPSPIQQVFATTLNGPNTPAATYSSGDDGDSEVEDSLASLIEIMKLCQSAYDSAEIVFSVYFDDAQSFFETREQQEEFMDQFEGGTLNVWISQIVPNIWITLYLLECYNN
ncbi:hypothetical protein C9374_005908 [Naegleria lovaniensis]|uniref:Uncharacterized protein n=1 Tax=Naegleria lovaniensis TaxID=51637 RepID=A0AA88KN24_NAELO|nr:uncharacterized protein C9374_005908 [Naegleria lovaniensis]KAG2382116.1 hypothetical protein C9374_005908 [Naegleria lovaniensis]